MRLGLTNQIVDDSDSKLCDFDRQFRLLISVRFKIQRRIRMDNRDFDIKSIKFDLFLIKIDLFQYIFDKNIKFNQPNVELFNKKQQFINLK